MRGEVKHIQVFILALSKTVCSRHMICAGQAQVSLCYFLLFFFLVVGLFSFTYLVAVTVGFLLGGRKGNKRPGVFFFFWVGGVVGLFWEFVHAFLNPWTKHYTCSNSPPINVRRHNRKLSNQIQSILICRLPIPV